MKYITNNIDIDISKYIQEGAGLESIFKYNPDIYKTAYINWNMDCGRSQAAQFVVIGEAYFSTALNLIQQCIEYNGDKKADFWIFPILFNIIHGTEVYLKAINKVVSAELNKQQSITEGGHNLQSLCESVLKNINMLRKNKNCDINKVDEKRNVFIQAGAGIVFDSVKENEYKEICNKRASVVGVFEKNAKKC